MPGSLPCPPQTPPHNPGAPRNRWPGLWLIILGMAFCLAAWNLTSPGLYYDELLFVNAARGAPTDSFIKLKLGPVPVLLMDYIGALKAWIYYPLLALFPVNEWTLRLPAIAFGLGGAAFCAAAVKRLFGQVAGTIALLLISFDPTLLTHSRLDWGPNALMFFLRGGLLYTLVRWREHSSPRWAWWCLIIIVAGLFEKLNFLWLAFATIMAVGCVCKKEMATAIRHNPIQTLSCAIILIFVVAAATVRACLIGQTMPITAVTWAERIPYAFHLLYLTSVGGGALDFICGNGLRLAPLVMPGYVFCIVGACCGGWIFIGRYSKEREALLFLVVFTLAVTGLFVATKAATGPHHSAVTSGLPQMVLAPLLAAAWSAPKKSGRMLVRRFLACAGIASLCIGFLAATITCLHAFHYKITNPNWDPANTKLARFVANHPEERFICTDWGMATQLITFSSTPKKIMDDWPRFIKPSDAYARVTMHLKEGRSYYIVRLDGFATMTTTRLNLLSALQAHGLSPALIATFPNLQNQPMIEVLTAGPSAQ